MFENLPASFRKHNIAADVRTLLLLRKSIDRGLVHTLGDLYLVLKGLLTNNPSDIGPYTTAFYDYFLNVDIKKGESLDKAIARSESFQDWKKTLLEEVDFPEMPDIKELVERFLDDVHLSSFDIKKILDGKDILNQDDPSRKDLNPQTDHSLPETMEQAADYRDISLEELRRRMEEVAKQQKGRHTGGSHWIGEGGVSPYGQNGAAMGGIRVGEGGGGKMARAVIGNPQFYPVDTKAILKDDNIDAALATLKGIEDESAQVYLDIPKTITEGLRQGGIFLPHEKEKIDQKVQVVLLIDNGGLSMSPYIRAVTKLFSKMKTRFAHDLKTYYFHNTIYGGAYSDVRRREFVPIDKILALDVNYSVFIIGDADMAPYELSKGSVDNWKILKERFPRLVWLNPMQERFWYVSDTVPFMRQIFPMYYLSIEGIEKAVQEMNKKRKYYKR